MRKLCALLLLMSGLALAVIWMPGRDGDHQLAVVTEIAGKGLARVQSPVERAPRYSERAAAAEPPAGERRARTFSPDTPLAPPERAPIQQATAEPAITTSSTGELRVSSAVRPTAPSAGARLATTLPADDASRYDLVRSIQRELRRVGCYGGEIDGSWGAGSKRAMSTFIERANAYLPVEQPDYILLSLVQGHGGQVCGKGCPTGQTLSDGGRCTPSVVVAQTAKRPANREAQPAARTSTADGWSTSLQVAPGATAAPALLAAPLPGRMAVGGPHTPEAPQFDASGLTPPQTYGDRGGADAYSQSNRPPLGGRSAGAGARPVVVYRAARSAYASRSAPRAAPRRLNFNDVFR